MGSFGEEYGKLIRKRRESYGETLEQSALGAFGEANKKTRISELENGKVKRPQPKTLAALNAHFVITEAELDVCRHPAPADAAQQTHLEALNAYVAQLKTRLATQEAELTLAHDETRATLTAQIAELKSRLANPEAALAQAEATIANLRDTLEREGNQLGAALEAKARKALDDKDFIAADEIFAQIEAAEELAVQRAARAAFARGKIAEEQVRWPEALTHFQRAANLHPCALHFNRTGHLLWRLGRYADALTEARRYLAAAIAEEGENSAHHATALNENALMLNALGRNEEAEPLYKQALDIGKATIGEGHPNYAIRLNNLANLYQDMRRLAEAEPLYKQALDIDKATIGEGHPAYAIRLNNLALLYREMGRLAEAEPLFKQALDITKATLGEGHPDYAICLNNLAGLYRAMGRLAEAEPLLTQAIAISTAALGPDHPQTKAFIANLT